MYCIVSHVNFWLLESPIDGLRRPPSNYLLSNLNKSASIRMLPQSTQNKALKVIILSIFCLWVCGFWHNNKSFFVSKRIVSYVNNEWAEVLFNYVPSSHSHCQRSVAKLTVSVVHYPHYIIFLHRWPRSFTILVMLLSSTRWPWYQCSSSPIWRCWSCSSKRIPANPPSSPAILNSAVGQPWHAANPGPVLQWAACCNIKSCTVLLNCVPKDILLLESTTSCQCTSLQTACSTDH